MKLYEENTLKHKNILCLQKIRFYTNYGHYEFEQRRFDSPASPTNTMTGVLDGP